MWQIGTNAVTNAEVDRGPVASASRTRARSPPSIVGS